MNGMRLAAGLLTVLASGADFATGLAAYERRDYAAAIREWQPLADAGDASAQFNLGLLHYDGLGVPQNFAEAAEWFRKAADKGYTKAQLNLGAMYGTGRGVKRDFVQSYMWLAICGASGDQKCLAQRDLVAQKLKPDKLAAAQRMAREWKKSAAQ